jgi:TLC domain
MSSHTAHTCVAFVFLLLVTTVGAIGWYSTGMVAAKSVAAASRLLVVQPAALWLAAVVTGMMALWDIPTSIRVKSLRKPDVLVHHILMTVISYLGATQVPTLYVFFHLGVSELSSLPLLLYDQLTHQLQGFENKSQDDHGTSREDDGDNQQEQQRRTAKLIQAQEVMKPVTAILFTIVRAFWFTKVTIFGYVPDVLSVLRTNAATAAGKAAVLQFTMVAGIGFTALQLYWFYSQIVCTLLDTYKSAQIRE